MEYGQTERVNEFLAICGRTARLLTQLACCPSSLTTDMTREWASNLRNQIATIVVKLNSLRLQVKWIRLEHFARTRGLIIYIFPAMHTRTKSTGPTILRLRAEDLLQQQDQGSKIPFPRLFLYTPGMPAVILSNLHTSRAGQRSNRHGGRNCDRPNW